MDHSAVDALVVALSAFSPPPATYRKSMPHYSRTRREWILNSATSLGGLTLLNQDVDRLYGSSFSRQQPGSSESIRLIASILTPGKNDTPGAQGDEAVYSSRSWTSACSMTFNSVVLKFADLDVPDSVG